MAKKRRSNDQLKEIDTLVERLRDFTRHSYVTAAEIARQIELLWRGFWDSPDQIEDYPTSVQSIRI